MKASAWPTVGRRMSPRGSLGLGSSAMRRRRPRSADVLADEVDGLLVAVERQSHVLGGFGLHALAAAPQDEDLCPELGAELDGLARLLDREAPDPGVVGGERALLEDRTPEQVGRHHGDVHAGGVERPPEALDDVLARPLAGEPSGTRSLSWKLTP